jgi:hypothetical protein
VCVLWLVGLGPLDGAGEGRQWRVTIPLAGLQGTVADGDSIVACVQAVNPAGLASSWVCSLPFLVVPTAGMD